MSGQWWAWVRRDEGLRACATCGAVFLLTIVYGRAECRVCGAAGTDSVDREQSETEAAALASQTEQAAAAMAEWEALR